MNFYTDAHKTSYGTASDNQCIFDPEEIYDNYKNPPHYIEEIMDDETNTEKHDKDGKKLNRSSSSSISISMPFNWRDVFEDTPVYIPSVRIDNCATSACEHTMPTNALVSRKISNKTIDENSSSVQPSVSMSPTLEIKKGIEGISLDGAFCEDVYDYATADYQSVHNSTYNYNIDGNCHYFGRHENKTRSHHQLPSKIMNPHNILRKPSPPSRSPKLVEHNYIDYSRVLDRVAEDPDQVMNGETIEELMIDAKHSVEVPPLPCKRVVSDPDNFPKKLYVVLSMQKRYGDIITWLPHGRSFLVRDPEGMSSEVFPKFFKLKKYNSFIRQLSLWGFKRMTKSTDAKSYYSPYFIRGKPSLLPRMKLVLVKGTGTKLKSNPKAEPEFTMLAKIRPVPQIDPEAELWYERNLDH